MPLARVLDENLTLFKERVFPFTSRYNSAHPFQAVIGVGGNVGDVKRRFHHLFYFLQRDPRVNVIQTSPVLKNPAFGYENQADFFNSVLVIQTSLRPKALLRYLLNVERRFGRKRSFANAPRTLDLDILFYDNYEHCDAILCVPHPHWHERESVVIPLSELEA
ncbi:MAG TPA: 2-amino-4-hydroxy-6-hydroxymethyldihydropteridine diphosphokinase [Helicobacteraceae bacterium]|nr:2-amino-4-hydroxy-6-hydroxymethyldihydropteridine diphosphokinase [Helicobacteraceae bacterium]